MSRLSREQEEDTRNQDAVKIIKTVDKDGYPQRIKVWHTELNEPKDRSVEVAFEQTWPKQLVWDNPITSCWHNPSDISFNFGLSNGEKTQFPCTDIELQESVRPGGMEVRKIVLQEFLNEWHPDQYGNLDRKAKPYFLTNQKHRSVVGLHGFELLGDENFSLLKCGYFGNKNAKTREIKLERGERILGICSRTEKRYGH